MIKKKFKSEFDLSQKMIGIKNHSIKKLYNKFKLATN